MDNSYTTLVFINPTFTKGNIYYVEDRNYLFRQIDLRVDYAGTLLVNEEFIRKSSQLESLFERYVEVDKKIPIIDFTLVTDPLNLSSSYLINTINSKYPGRLENNFAMLFALSQDLTKVSLYLVWDGDPTPGKAQYQTLKAIDVVGIPPELVMI